MKTSRDSRQTGIRQARRVSNWTAAFLLALTAGATAALAREASHTVVSSNPGAAGGTRPTASGPQVSHSVATTTPSGVTTTTTTHNVNGKTVITRVRSGHWRGDD